MYSSTHASTVAEAGEVDSTVHRWADVGFSFLDHKLNAQWAGAAEETV